MKYAQYLKQENYSIDNYKIMPFRGEDIMLVKEWRNAQMSVLRQTNILTEDDQNKYYSTVVMKSFRETNPNIMLFSFLYNCECIGYGGLTNIHWIDKRIELSFLVDPQRAAEIKTYENDFKHFIQLMKYITFEELNFNRMYTETYDIREHHIRILENEHFFLEGRMKEHVFIEGMYVDALLHGITKKQYLKTKTNHGI